MHTFGGFFPDDNRILHFYLAFGIQNCFLVVVFVVIVVSSSAWDKRRADFPSIQHIKRKICQPRMAFDFFWAIVPKPARWFPLYQLPHKSPSTYQPVYHLSLTLFTKSHASKDQSSGTSSLLIETCLARIWSLISLLEWPM
jgi:hypothetical protein